MRPRSRLGPGAEFDLLQHVFERAPQVPSPWVEVGPGDDAALLSGDGAYWAVTTDLAVEGIHFRLEWLDPSEAAGRAVRAALSDLAAVAAEPVGVLVSASVPDRMDAARAEATLLAAAAAAAECGAALLGGDLARGGDRFALDVAAVGRATRPALRSGARPGDELWVTGTLGAAAAAVRAWSTGAEPTPAARERFARPVPRWREALWLAGRRAAAAMIDLSDGLVADAGHVAAASGVALEIDAADVPLAPDATLADALSGGEDYELLFTAPPEALADAPARFEAEHGTPLRRIGRVVVGSGVRVFAPGGRPLPVDAPGYDHFRDR